MVGWLVGFGFDLAWGWVWVPRTGRRSFLPGEKKRRSSGSEAGRWRLATGHLVSFYDGLTEASLVSRAPRSSERSPRRASEVFSSRSPSDALSYRFFSLGFWAPVLKQTTERSWYQLIQTSLLEDLVVESGTKSGWVVFGGTSGFLVEVYVELQSCLRGDGKNGFTGEIDGVQSM